MLASAPGKKYGVVSLEKREGELLLKLSCGMLCLTPVSDRILRIRFTEKEFFSNAEKPGIVLKESCGDPAVSETQEEIFAELGQLTAVITKKTGSIRFLDAQGQLLVREREHNSRELEEFPVYRISEEGLKKEVIETPDGKKEVVREAGRILTGNAYHTRLHLCFAEGEELYGLGQHEEGYAGLRGERVYLHQANRKIAVPMMVSTKGYGILVNTYSPAIFNDTKEGTYFYTEADPELDYFVMNGGSMDGVIRQYRNLTGQATLLPKWAFGYIQSQERYETQEEILKVAEEYRKRRIGLDCLVLDWCSWAGNQWGQKTFDPERFPNPDGMTEELHKEHIHFMISIWPNMAEHVENYLEFKEKGQLLPGQPIYDALSEAARKTYWQQAERGLYSHGVDAWWCDNSEPFTPEWNHLLKPENSEMYGEYVRNAGNHLPAEMSNAYGFYHALGIYEGQRDADEKAGRKKRVVNLTRSGYLGQQRLGTILWSGDIAANWDTLRRQIAAGLQFCASGLPYWTVDIGAFFVKNGMQWFWKGDYDGGAGDPGYCELFTRWYQWGAFLPVFRGHGTEIRRELWEFDQDDAPFYEAILKANRLRYELLPYIYSLAGKVWKDGALMMKPLSFGFSQDPETYRIADQYLFGDGLMVCPVTESMYFEKDGRKIDREKTRKVYLPEGAKWYNFWTEECLEGGRWITADAPLDRLPLFVKAGTILPCAAPALSVEELSEELTVKIYAGSDGAFELYRDAGDGWDYEKGEYELTRICWSESKGEWTVDGVLPEKTAFHVIKPAAKIEE